MKVTDILTACVGKAKATASDAATFGRMRLHTVTASDIRSNVTTDRIGARLAVKRSYKHGKRRLLAQFSSTGSFSRFSCRSLFNETTKIDLVNDNLFQTLPSYWSSDVSHQSPPYETSDLGIYSYYNSYSRVSVPPNGSTHSYY